MFSTWFMVSRNNICLHLKHKNSQLVFVCPNMRDINKHFWLCCTILLWMKLLFIIVIKRVYANKRTSTLLLPSRWQYFENLTTIQFTAVFSFLWTKTECWQCNLWLHSIHGNSSHGIILLCALYITVRHNIFGNSQWIFNKTRKATKMKFFLL